MNPLDAETCMAAYIQTVSGIGGIVPVHTGTTAQDIEMDLSLVVAEAAEVEHTAGFLYLVTMNVALRSPAPAISLVTHSTRWGLINNALEDLTAMATSFEDTIASQDLQIAFAGRYVNSLTTTIEDRAWISSASMNLGIATI